MPCPYCDVAGHGRDECPERLEDKFADSSEYAADGSRVELREGDQPDDDAHADVVARQLAEADAETRAGIDADEEDREARTDGGATLSGWNPRSSDSSAPRCQNCGTQVTRQFARVFGDNRDVIHACPACETYREMKNAATNGGDGQ